MAAMPFMPFYVSEYLADTTHLSTEESGAYLFLIMAYWQAGEALPDDDRKLARAARLSSERWAAIREDMADFFSIEEGRWVHQRIERELSKAQAKVEQAQRAGRASAESRFNARSTAAKRKRNHRERDGDKEEPKGSPPIVPQAENPFAGEAWDGWIAQRDKPPTARAIELSIEKLAKLQADGHPPDEVLNQSTMNGWIGLFPLKGQSNGRSRNGHDNRDGVSKALDRRAGFGDPAGTAGRLDAGDGEGNRRLPAPGAGTER